MKKEELFETLGDLDDDLIQNAKTKKSRKKKRSWKPFAIAAAALAAGLLVGIRFLLRPDSGSLPSTVLAAYEPDFTAAYDGSPLEEAYLSDIRSFSVRAGNVLLNGQDSVAYSPAALYTALSMVAELADGDSLDSLLEALEASGTEELRKNTGNLWRYLCNNPDVKAPGKVRMANSLWLNRDYDFNGESLQDLADHYYVASYTGEMQKEIPKLVSRWVKEQTNGLLDCEVKPTLNTMALLLSAVYFYDEWADTFRKPDVTDGRFQNSKGEWVSVNYMNRTEKDRAYYRADGVTASVQYFQNGGKMLFLLPDEGKSPADVLSDTALMASLLDWENSAKDTGTVKWCIPRFTLSSTLDLEEGLRALGLGGLFSGPDGDDNPLPKLSDNTAAYIGRAEQGTSVSINEKGCEASSYVLIEAQAKGADLPSDEIVYLKLTRPFVFAVLSENDVPLFLGVVNDPNG